jgi:hypothetical protein
LRRKLGEPAIIDTVVGSGYRIDPAALIALSRVEEGVGNVS